MVRQESRLVDMLGRRAARHRAVPRPTPVLADRAVGAVVQRVVPGHEVGVGLLLDLPGAAKVVGVRRDRREEPVVEQEVVGAVGIVILEVLGRVRASRELTTASAGSSGEASLLPIRLNGEGRDRVLVAQVPVAAARPARHSGREGSSAIVQRDRPSALLKPVTM